MKIFTHKHPIPDNFKHAVVAIGNFDGMHQGHRTLIDQAAQLAKKQNVPLGILTFEPHPRCVFQPHESPFRITPPSVKQEKIAETDVDFLVEINFTREFAQKSADDFVKDVLIKQLDAKHIFIGTDFHFGQNRLGSANTIKNHGLDVQSVIIVEDEHKQKYSASRVRSHLRRGMIAEANTILGWNWEIRGTVIHGDKRGREMGYPTANVSLGKTLHPAFGVYATFVQIEGEDIWRPAATNIGIRPMFETQDALIESFILDFDGDLYDKILRIRPVQKIRDEARFNSLDELILQIDKDCTTIRKLLNA